jgi:GT2 family glycosyltransferase
MSQPSEPVVVVILTRDDRDRTLRCVDRVLASECVSVEVLVVDNGSRDGTLAAVAERFAAVHCVRSETNLGVAGGRNLGMAEAQKRFPGALVFFLDNDAWPERNAVCEMLRALAADPGAALVAPKVHRPSAPAVIGAVGGHRVNWYTGTVQSVGAGEVDVGQYDGREPRTVNGGAVLVRPEVFAALDGFDEVFHPYGWEDVDFGLRAHAAGHRIRLAPRAVVWHEGGKAGRGRALPEYERSKARGWFVLLKRHATPWQRLCCACYTPLRAAGWVLRDVGRGDWRVSAAHARGALAAFAERWADRGPAGGPAGGRDGR